jgi:hypothetical protein
MCLAMTIDIYIEKSDTQYSELAFEFLLLNLTVGGRVGFLRCSHLQRWVKNTTKDHSDPHPPLTTRSSLSAHHRENSVLLPFKPSPSPHSHLHLQRQTVNTALRCTTLAHAVYRTGQSTVHIYLNFLPCSVPDNDTAKSDTQHSQLGFSVPRMTADRVESVQLFTASG